MANRNVSEEIRDRWSRIGTVVPVTKARVTRDAWNTWVSTGKVGLVRVDDSVTTRIRKRTLGSGEWIAHCLLTSL